MADMEDSGFEIVDNEKMRLSRHSLERLKALAPTFPERSSQRLACVELIAAREQALALTAIRTASRRASLALTVGVLAILLPLVYIGGWFLFRSMQPVPEPVRKRAPVVARPLPTSTPSPSPEEEEPQKTPEPLPALLGEPPPSPRPG